MPISETVISSILTFSLTTPLMLWVGRRFSKGDAKNAIYNNRIDTTICSIRCLSDEAISYYTSEMEVRERDGLTGAIISNYRRISTDISDIAKNTDNIGTDYIVHLTRYHESITTEPFGDSDFNKLNHNDQKIDNIRNSEDYLISVLRGMISK